MGIRRIKVVESVTEDQMSKQTNLAVVTEELSPARRDLADAQSQKARAQAAQEEVMRQHQRIESKLNAGPALRARIDQLQAEHTKLIEQWMLAGSDAPHPVLPHAVEITELVAELAQADGLEKGAQSALAKINSELTACQATVAQAIEAIKAAADQVLVESAAAMARELEQTERRAAQLRGELIALQRHFFLEGFRRRQVGDAQMAVARLIPKGPLEMMPQSIELAVSKWSELASQLFTNENAELEQTR